MAVKGSGARTRLEEGQPWALDAVGKFFGRRPETVRWWLWIFRERMPPAHYRPSGRHPRRIRILWTEEVIMLRGLVERKLWGPRRALAKGVGGQKARKRVRG